MADIVWTDPRDGKNWRVYNFNTSDGVATYPWDAKPDFGEDRISFRHPPRPAETKEAYSVGNPQEHQVTELDDSILCGLLDSATET